MWFLENFPDFSSLLVEHSKYIFKVWSWHVPLRINKLGAEIFKHCNRDICMWCNTLAIYIFKKNLDLSLILKQVLVADFLCSTQKFTPLLCINSICPEKWYFSRKIQFSWKVLYEEEMSETNYKKYQENALYFHG